MEKETITFADQEIANRLASRRHFLKDMETLIDWNRIRRSCLKWSSDAIQWQVGTHFRSS